MCDEPQQAVILIPSLEPDQRLPAYVDRLLAKGFRHVLIVDDGSPERYQPIFQSLSEKPGCTVVHHDVNHGKGVALKTGYAWIEQHLPDCTGVITADADGQHTVEDCWKLAEALRSGKRALYLGSRDFTLPDIPPKSRFGNRLTSLVGIEQLPKLTALTADGNAVTDLTGLGRCLNVRKLSLNGANVSDLSELRALTKLQDVTLSHCTRRELLIPLHKSSLTRVTLVDCDLRGDFFRSFDRERAITSLTLIRCELDSTSGLEDFTGLTELTVRGVSGTLDWSALGGLPLQTVTADALQADAIAAAATAAVTVVD